MAKIDTEKIKKVLENMVMFDPLGKCREGIHSDRCVGISGGKIWWKCMSCGRIEGQEDRPITI